MRHLTIKAFKFALIVFSFRWSWFLLQHFHSYLSDKYLQKLSTDISRALKNIRSDETEFPAPFPLTSIPHITVFKPQPLSTQLSVKQSVTLFPSLVSSTETTQVSEDKHKTETLRVY